MRARLKLLTAWLGEHLPRRLGEQLPGGLKRWISLLSAGFLLAALVAHGQQLLQLSLDRQGWLWLVLGVGLSLVSLVANGLALGAVLNWLGLKPHWQPLLLAYLQTNLRKYMPGGIWHLTARINLLHGPGAPLASPASGAVALLAVLLDSLVAAVTALALVSLGGFQAGLGLACLLPLLLLLPRWLNPLLERLERRQAPELGLENLTTLLEQAPRLPSYPWPLLLAQLGFVLLRFSGFACCVLAFDLQWSLDWTGWLAGFALAWTAGLVVPGAPGGLGVFEAVLLLRLGVAVPEASVLAIAISYRLVVSLADLLAALTARLDTGSLDAARLDAEGLDSP